MFGITPQIFLILKRPQAQSDAPKSLTKNSPGDEIPERDIGSYTLLRLTPATEGFH